MPKKIGNVARDILVNAALPAATKTYTVISHEYVIETIEEALDANGFTVTEEHFRCASGAQVAHGTFVIEYAGDPELGLIYSFANSYDKSMKFRSAVGAQILANGSYMIRETDHWNRKHTGTSDLETKELINEHIENAQSYFQELQNAKDAMIHIEIGQAEFGHIIGELYLNDYLSTDQMSLIYKENKNPSFPYKESQYNLWTCYQQITNALRQSHPSKWMQNQVAVHLFFATKYDFTTFDVEENQEPVLDGIYDGVEDISSRPGFELPALPEPVEEVEECVDPAQISIDDVIAENVDIAADVEMQEMKTEEVIEERSEGESGKEESPFLDVHPGHPEATLSADGNPIVHIENDLEYQERVVEIENEASVEEATEMLYGVDNGDIEVTAAEEVEEVYFWKEEYPGVNVGDAIEADDSYYEILSEGIAEDEEYWLCKAINLDDIAEEEVEAPMETAVDMPLLEKEEVVNLPDIAPPVVPEVLEQVDLSVLDITPEEEVVEEVEEEAVEEFGEEEVVEATTPDDLTEDTSPVREAIAAELEDLYGEASEFTYELINNQYNVMLESGETVTLSSAYIDAVI